MSRFNELMDGYVSDSLSDEEVIELLDLLENTSGPWPAAIEELLRERSLAGMGTTATGEKIFQRVLEISKDQEPVRRSVVQMPLFRWVAAAAILLIITGVVYFIQIRHTANVNYAEQRNTPEASAPIVPGGDKATLTLAGGAVIVLDSATNGVLASQTGINIIKQANGQLLVDASGASPGENGATGYNTINTPRGGQYMITLPDGSNVWLNAASSLRFPTAFREKDRNVQLTGEAYFEVSKNRNKPFKITVNNMEVEVLGTHFNIMAYDEEGYKETTLLEGAVRIHAGTQAALLKPGQQAMLGMQTDAIKVLDVDTEGAVAWKNGYFLFDKENIQQIMRKIARWYDVEVEYRGNVTQKAFGGTVSRFKNVTEVLDMLELTGSVKFIIEGKKIIVMPG